MNKDIRRGRWLRVRGRMKMWWAKLTRDETLEAAANADLVAGALQESYGIAKRDGLREVSRTIDAVAGATKRKLKQIDSIL